MDKALQIDKLNSGEQWMAWKFQVKLALMSIDVYEVVDGSLVRTVANENEFRKKDNKACAIIGTSVGPEQINHIIHCETAKEMWDVLHMVHEQKNEQEKARLSALFWNYAVAQEETMAGAISRLNDIVKRLEKNDEKVSESSKMFRLLDALPAEYNSFKSAWDSTVASDKTFQNMCERLITEESRRGGARTVESEALVARDRKCSCACNCGVKTGQSPSVSFKKPFVPRKVRCYWCKEEGT